MFNGDPKPLGQNAAILDFIPDTTCAWIIAYAALCPECQGEETHDRIYLVPMIGWFYIDNNGGEVRPAIMAGDGTVNDYLDVPAHFKFIAVIPDNENAYNVARVIYSKRFTDGPGLDIEEEALDWMPN